MEAAVGGVAADAPPVAASPVRVFPGTMVGSGQHRGRRSASHMPVLVDPVEIAEDAAGRIDYIFVDPVVADHVAPPPAAIRSSGPAREASWIPVVGVALVLVVVFIAGILLTR